MKKIIKTKSPKEILFWLKNNDYSRIPVELWDKYLWSYEILLNKMSEELTVWENNELDMYLIMQENDMKGFCIYDGKEKSLTFDGNYDDFEKIFNKISKDNLVKSSISFRRKTIANLFFNNK